MAGARPLQIGRYVLHDEIAAGGMAAVHFGRLVGTGGFAKTVAIKRLHRHLVREPTFRNMILEEARLASRIRHPNVVPPLDVLGEAGELLLVMEYVHGESLSRLLKAAKAANEKVPVAIASAIFASVLHGLHAAHEAKDESGSPLDIVHRDVSPQNVLVGADGVTRVIDFGIAKAVDTGEQTVAGTIKGKVPYLSPEQLDGEQATRRTDIYAASLCLWETLAGKRLMDGADDSEILRQIVTMDVPPPSAYNPAVPAAIDDVVLKGLMRNPAYRFSTAREMALAIESAVHPATATQVGAWAERLSGPALSERAAKLAMIEAAGDDEGEDAPTEMLVRPEPVASPSARRSPADAAAPRPAAGLPPTVAGRRGDAPAPASMRPPPAPASVRPPPPAPASVRPPPPAPASMRPPPTAPMPMQPMAPPPVMMSAAVSQGPSPPTERLAYPSVPPEPPRPPPAGALRKPELEIPNVAWLPETAAPPPSALPTSRDPQGGSRSVPWLVGFVVVLLVSAWLGAPFAISALVVAAAAKHNVVVTIDRVEISRRSVRLVDVRAETAELQGVSLHAGSAVLALRSLSPSALTLDDVELTVDGAWPDVLDRVTRWRAAHDDALAQTFAKYEQVAVTSGRVDWKQIAGAETSLVLENLSADVSKRGARLFGDDWRVNAPLVSLKVGTAIAGPWLLDADRQGTLSRAVLRLDPSGSYAATITWSRSDDGAESMAFAIPPTRLADLHVPPAMLLGLGNERSRIEARGEVSIVGSATGRPANGRLTLAASDLAVFAGTDRVDVSLDVPVSGDASQPLAITTAGPATLSIAAADPSGAPSRPATTASLVGKLELKPGLQLELGGRTSALSCGSVAGTSVVVVSIDVRAHDLPKSQLVLKPQNPCAPRLR